MTRQLLLGSLVLGVLALGLLCLGGVACGPSSDEKLEARPVPRLDLRTPLSVAGLTIEAEVAVHQPEIRDGMMWRRELPEDQGMLFLFRTARDRSFYMKNVPIPLDICFLDDEGVLINVVADAEPQRVEPKLLSERPARFVLELAGGWAERHGLGPGDRIEIPEELIGLAELP